MPRKTIPNKTIIFLVGPTAAGKTDAAVTLAGKINAEIISCDSMQIYKGMDIVTSKPPARSRKKIRHHLVDMVSPAKEYNVSKYRKDALGKIKEIIRRGKTPLFVGGTGLYMSILVDGIFSAKSQNKNIRQRLYKEAQKKGSQYLHERLSGVDLAAAGKIHPNDTKRIIRALEVFESTGKPISELQKQRKGLINEYDVKIFCLNMEREKLYRRIERRIDDMFAEGLLDEVKQLLKSRLSKTARYAIGINEIKGYLDGLYDLEEAKQLMKKNTRVYAKKQLTWFRKDKRINWVNVGDKDTPAAIAGKVLKEIS